MKSRVLLVAALLLMLRAAFAFGATRPTAEQDKIDWLIAQIRDSDAVFLRNGSEYDGAKAASHIKSKLWFAGKRVQTARDFILGCASHSEETGKPYEIRPKGSAASQPLGPWLVARLIEHEKPRASLTKRP
jgi:Family of unknown function (DUF5329)